MFENIKIKHYKGYSKLDSFDIKIYNFSAELNIKYHSLKESELSFNIQDFPPSKVLYLSIPFVSFNLDFTIS